MYRMRLADLGIQGRPGNDERQSGQLIARGLSPPCLPAQEDERAHSKTVRSRRGVP